jgi:sugar lactone lactonase YvrE
VAGNHTVGYSGDGGSALNATFSTTISNATTDPAGNIYIADTGDSVIRRVDAITGVITTVAGTGTAGYVASQDGGPATSAELNKPVSVRYHQGLLYIADSTNNRIRTLNLTTGIITTFAGGGSAVLTTGSQPITGTKGVSIPAPQDIAFDNTGDLYYTTQAGKPTVGRIVISTAMASLYAGSTSGGGYSGDGGLATKALLSGPIGIAVDAQNNLFIGDGGNKAVRRIDASTGIITTYMGGSSAVVCAAATDPVGDGCPAAQATLVGLGHISFDGTGALLVADPLNNRVRRIAPGTGGAGGIVTTIAGTGASPSTADGSYAVNTALGGPNDIELTPGGDLLVVERSIEAVRVIHVASVFAPTALGNTSSASTVFVQTQAASGTFTLPGATDFSGGAAPACTAGVHVTGNVCSYTLSFAPTLSGLRTTPLVFTDSNGSVRAGLAGIGLGPAASLLPGSMTTIAGTGTAGSSGDSSAATGAQLNSPSSVTFDGQGNLFIADSANNEVRMISGSGVITRVAGAGSAGSTGDGGPATSALLNAPHGITVDNAGNLYIADTGNNKIRFVDNLTGLISTYAGTGIASYIGDGGPATAATFNAPYGLSLTPQGVLYVADTGNNAIRSIASNSGLVTTFAGSSSGGFSGDGGAAAVAQLSGPKGVVSDASGNVYIADSGNNRIRLVNVSGIISTIAGQQGSGYTGDGSAAAAELYSPTGVAVDAAGTLYIADAMNHRLRVISEGQIATVAGTGTAAATGDGGSSVAATLNAPLGVALDGTGDVLIADSGNNKVRKISVGTNALAFPKTNPGDTTPAQTVALYNSGNQPLSLSSASIPSGYIEQTSSTSTNCSAAPLTLNPGASCVLQTSFQPPALGNYNGAITVTDNSESVSAATQSISLSAVSAYVFTPSVTLPGNTISGTSFTGTVSVSNPIATYTGTIHFTSSDPKAALPSDYTYALADNSSHNFSFTLRTAGIQCVTVTDISDSTVTATGCTVVAAGTPAAIAVYSGNNQSANVSTVYASRLAVQVTDASGNPVPKAQVIFTAPPSTASAYGTFPGASGPQATDTETTDLSGFANSAALTSGPNIGTFQVTASATGVSTPAAFNLSIVILGSFTLGPTSTQTGPLEPGISNTQIVNIVPTGGFSAPVTMTCKAPATITCTMTPSTVLFANGKPVNQPELSFQSEGPIGTTSSLGANPFAIVATIAMFLAMFRKRRSFRTLILGIAVAFALFGMGGCGNSLTPQTTPNGTYTVTVTGTAQTVSASTSVTYTIQR